MKTLKSLNLNFDKRLTLRNKRKSNKNSFQHHYRLLNKIGEGAFSTTYRVLELRTKKIFAAKLTQTVDTEIEDQVWLLRGFL